MRLRTSHLDSTDNSFAMDQSKFIFCIVFNWPHNFSFNFCVASKIVISRYLSALRTIHKGIFYFQISPCHFHWLQALDRQLSKKGLTRLLRHRQGEIFRHGIRLLKALAYVPPEHIHEGYQAVVQGYFDVHCEVKIYIVSFQVLDFYWIFLKIGFGNIFTGVGLSIGTGRGIIYRCGPVLQFC